MRQYLELMEHILAVGVPPSDFEPYADGVHGERHDRFVQLSNTQTDLGSCLPGCAIIPTVL